MYIFALSNGGVLLPLQLLALRSRLHVLCKDLGSLCRKRCQMCVMKGREECGLDRGWEGGVDGG